MESVPEPRPSEWDKRLSTHSPFRSLNINGQIPTGEGVSTLSTWPVGRMNKISVFVYYCSVSERKFRAEICFWCLTNSWQLSSNTCFLSHVGDPVWLLEPLRAPGGCVGPENSLCSCMLVSVCKLAISQWNFMFKLCLQGPESVLNLVRSKLERNKYFLKNFMWTFAQLRNIWYGWSQLYNKPRRPLSQRV